jgi:hypothetical protein
MEPFTTAEAAIRHVKSLPFDGTPFELPIAEAFTLDGRPDPMGMGMAIVVDGILKHGYFPRGFEQRQGYRLYKYALGPGV